MKKIYILSILLFLLSTSGMAVSWQSHLAYNNVTSIAISPTEVYALSDGSLFSVNIITERITLHGSGTGLHSTNIHNIGYDPTSQQLLVVYETGKMDIIDKDGRVQYISDFYTKDITATKTTNNITFHNGVVYMAEPFGVLTFSMTDHTFIQCCYIGDEASEVNVEDVVVYQDSVYAFSQKNLYVAYLKDNLLDYRYWHKTANNGRVQRDAKKQTEGVDIHGDLWKAGGEKGVLRHSITGEDFTYLPNGPLNNTIYRMACFGDKLYIVNGGAWATQYKRPGCVMILQNNKWHNITNEQITKQIANDPFYDCMNVVQDPQDADHYFVTTYGTGLFEMRGDNVINHFMPDNSTLTTAAPLYPKNYTRCVGAQIDSNGTLWAVSAGGEGAPLVFKKSDGEWGGLYPIVDGSPHVCNCPLTLLIDNQQERYKWIATFRSGVGILLVDDYNTLDDASDDRAIFRDTWQNQHGENITPVSILALYQDKKGNIWFGGENTGLLCITNTTDFFTSNQCQQLMTANENGVVIGKEETINDITEDKDGNLWVATNAGIYILQSDGTLLNHITVTNSILSTNNIFSLAYCEPLDCMYIGSADGLFSYSDHSTDITDNNTEFDQEQQDNMGSMLNWTNYFSYGRVSQVENADRMVFGLANGALFSVDKVSEEITTYAKGNGLNGSSVKHIAYDEQTRQLMIIYEDNLIDLLNRKGETYLMSDLYLKSFTLPFQVNTVLMNEGKAYLGLSFGVMSIDIRKREVENTYYIGANASSVNISSLAMVGDTLYAASADTIYYTSTHSNMMDFANWKQIIKPQINEKIQQIVGCNHELYILQKNKIYIYLNGAWQILDDTKQYIWMQNTNNRLVAAVSDVGLMTWHDNQWGIAEGRYWPYDATFDSSTQAYWVATNGSGIVRCLSGNYQRFLPSGPYSNTAFRVQTFGDQLMMSQGGRWASQEGRSGDAIWLNTSNHTWSVITKSQTKSQIDVNVNDLLYYAVDPNDPGHFYASSYGKGVIEYQNGKAIKNYSHNNSTLRSALGPSDPNLANYVRTDGVYLDSARNLWVLNTGGYAYPLNVMSPDGHWYGLPLRSNGQAIELNTPSYLIQDNKHPARKWFLEHRGSTGLILFDDGGTPYHSYDDRTIKRRSFIDQNGKAITPNYIYSLAQDHNGDLWVGYDEGLFIIPASYDFFSSEQCQRVIIPREDGTGLADYLLGTEQVQCIAIDGVNRKWIGTSSSGIYLVSEDGLEEISHFTAENSPLLSNEITSIAILDRTGEVFIGTSKGLISYHGDASQGQDNYSEAYAYPNPVRPNYIGTIAITGLMENSVVNIIDAAGNLVCKTRSNGGTAVWDGKDQRGHRAAAGIYTVLCNTVDGENHHVVKILVL